jgi:hypothetical protein
MTCTEFQEFLTDIIAWNPSSEEYAHLNSCRLCINLVTDQVAAAAKFVLSLEKPPFRVWHNIRRRLDSQELETAGTSPARD